MNKYKFLKLISFIALLHPALSGQNLENLILEPGFKISIFAENLSSPRQITEGKNGTIFVGERTGQIIALIDTDQNGQADYKRVIAKDLEYSTGISIFNGDLYFSEISKIWKIENIERWLNENISSLDLPKKIIVTDQLPSDKSHGWKWLKHDEEGSLYLNVGAPCNICLSENSQYASILKIKNGRWEHVARGVRNSVGFDFHPVTQKLFFTDNGRDWLGDDSPSCELNRVDQDGQFFGYPFKHAVNIMDPEFGNLNSGFDYVDPILELGAHVAPTGVAFYTGSMFPSQMKHNLFIALHGSWNRSSKVGYKVIRVSFDKNGNVEESNDFISGWLHNESVFGRPSAPFILSDGSMLLSDDKANVIYRITYEL
ncbi:MAG: sorbosone dehydrogenase [Flavobacteriales bacterium]|nr:sorbosone dehydrogenase [Flavobacteriales bacterium]